MMLAALAYAGAKGQTFDKKRYDSLSTVFHKGTLSFRELPWMVKKAEKFGQPEKTKLFADRFTVLLLARLDSLGYRKADIQLVREHTHSANDPGFGLFLERADKVDMALGSEGQARAQVEYVIARDEIDAKIWPNGSAISGSPDWESYRRNIIRKYGKGYDERAILGAQVRWYQAQKDEQNFIRYQLQFIERYGMDLDVVYRRAIWNNFLYNSVFKHSTDRAQLEKALLFSKRIVDMEPKTASYIDTYANLLYKLERKIEALEWQEKAYAIAPLDRDISNALELMRAGKKTW